MVGRSLRSYVVRRAREDYEAEIYYQRELQWSREMASCRVLDQVPFNPERRRQTPPTESISIRMSWR